MRELRQGLAWVIHIYGQAKARGFKRFNYYKARAKASSSVPEGALRASELYLFQPLNSRRPRSLYSYAHKGKLPLEMEVTKGAEGQARTCSLSVNIQDRESEGQSGWHTTVCTKETRKQGCDPEVRAPQG